MRCLLTERFNDYIIISQNIKELKELKELKEAIQFGWTNILKLILKMQILKKFRIILLNYIRMILGHINRKVKNFMIAKIIKKIECLYKCHNTFPSFHHFPTTS